MAAERSELDWPRAVDELRRKPPDEGGAALNQVVGKAASQRTAIQAGALAPALIKQLEVLARSARRVKGAEEEVLAAVAEVAAAIVQRVPVVDNRERVACRSLESSACSSCPWLRATSPP